MSTVILDTITGKSTATTITIGSTPVVSASANSMTIRGEGSAQTSIQQGLAKAWASIQLDDTVMDNFNSSAFTDNGTGDITHSFSNNMGNINYVNIGFNIRNNDGGTAWCGGYGSDSEGDIKNTTSATRIQHFNASNSAEDMRRAMVTVQGDLA